MSQWRLADVAERRGDVDTAAREFGAAPSLAERFAADGRLAPVDGDFPEGCGGGWRRWVVERLARTVPEC